MNKRVTRRKGEKVKMRKKNESECEKGRGNEWESEGGS